jgi:methylglutaconyl-CoA hydratase
MAAMFEALDTLPVPLVGRVHGAALGGGSGLVSVCDIVVAEEQTTFGFTETKLGIVPAVISPYALSKIGRSAARELFLTGGRFSAARAREIGLVHAVTTLAQIDETVAGFVRELLSAGPEAVSTIKQLIRAVWGRPASEVRDLTARTIAERRASEEGREGIRAFLEKRPPRWAK